MGSWLFDSHSMLLNIVAMGLIAFALLLNGTGWKKYWVRFSWPWTIAALLVSGIYISLIGSNAWLYIKTEWHDPLYWELTSQGLDLQMDGTRDRAEAVIDSEVEFKNPEKMFELDIYGETTLREHFITSLEYLLPVDETPNMKEINEQLEDIPHTCSFIEGWWSACYIDVGLLILSLLVYWAYGVRSGVKDSEMHDSRS